MKADGIEYEERMELLETSPTRGRWPSCSRRAYEIYRQGHPWVADHELSPKSVARDMYERAMTFTEYVGFYGLARSEGLVLRYLADAYQALRPYRARGRQDRGAHDLTEWLGELVRQVDSSLLDEWEKLRNPRRSRGTGAGRRPAAAPVTANQRAFRVLVRNAMFRRVELAALRRWEDLGELDARRGLGRRRLGARRWSRTSTSTTRSAPAPTRAVRSC